MQEKYLKILEANEIKEKLKEYAISDVAKKNIDELMPFTTKEEVLEKQRETSEAEKVIVQRGNIPIDKIYDIRMILERAKIHSTLDIKSFLMVFEILRNSRICKNFIDKVEDLNILRNLCEKINFLKDIEDRIDEVVENENEIKDSASSELKKIRRKIFNQNRNIKNKLNEIITSTKYQKLLQDTIVTVRNERFVIPLKAEAKSSVDGIVHDTSASGATIFIEPVSIVNMNNELSNLKKEEKVEIEKILSQLTVFVGDYQKEIRENLEILEKIDFIMAKGNLSCEMKGVSPDISNEKEIKLLNARHPLIDPKKVVKNNILVGEGYNVLVITGPNTGGKTVILKTIGLFSIMFQMGLHIPCDVGSKLFIFDNIFADIGDDQSILESLSTFSAHMTNIVNIMNTYTEDSLVLFDELGQGTDPVEGSSLAIAILDTLREKGVITVATTHYSELKNYALTKENVKNASVEFNVDTLSPTYKLIIGIPGKSNAFFISKKLGLSDEIIEKAKVNIKKDSQNMEDVIKKLDNIKKDYEKKDRDLRREVENVELLRLKLENKEERQKEAESKIIEEAKEKARKLVLNAKNEVDNINKNVKKMKKLSSYNKFEEGLANLKGDLKAFEEKYARKQEELIKKTKKHLKSVNVGDTVYVDSFKENGKVVSADDKKNEYLVQVGLFKITLKRENLSLPKEDSKKVLEKSKIGKIKKNKSENAKTSVDLRGMDLETAIYQLDKYIDNSYLAGLNEVTIIHGVGTLVLKKGIQNYLRTRQYVKSFRDGEYGEGGMGVTIVKLK